MSKQAIGGTAIALMWLGFVIMYLGLSGEAGSWAVAGLAVVGAGSLLVLRYW